MCITLYLHYRRKKQQQKQHQDFASAEQNDGIWLQKITGGSDFGIWKYPNGNEYHGGWLFDSQKKIYVRHGKGKLIFKNGGSYEGDWQNNLKWGKGVYSYPNGDIYQGEFNNDVRHGKGITHNSQGVQLQVGYWDNNKFVGQLQQGGPISDEQLARNSNIPQTDYNQICETNNNDQMEIKLHEYGQKQNDI